MLQRRGSSARRLAPITLARPYRGDINPPVNAAAKLTIPTSNGHGAMHPDVLDFGAAPFAGYRYWMAFTPYNNTATNEIPSVVACNDITAGGTWVVPTGYTNPITPNAGDGSHMADTDLVYDEGTGRLYVVYAHTNNSTTQGFRSKWTDGDGTWSTEVTLFSGPDNGIGNPSLIKTATGWRIYYSDDLAGLDVLKYRDTTTAPDSGYGSEVVCSFDLNFGAYQRKLQNLNIVRDVDGDLVLVVSDSLASTLAGTLFFARSTDGGDTFTITGPPVVDLGPAGAWDAAGIYRASLLTDTDGVVIEDAGQLHLWYSAYADAIASQWGTGYLQIPRAVIEL